MSHMGTVRNNAGLSAALLLSGALALTACGGPATTDGVSDGGGAETASAAPERTEVGALTPRIVLAHDKGVAVLDSADGTELADVPVKGYARLGQAGDGRHVMVAASGGFTALDTGLIEKAHGDHSHFFTQEPVLTKATVKGEEPGHVVPHGERTALFDDGTGQMTVFDPAALAEGTLGETARTKTSAPHHGVAVPLSAGSLLHTEGTEDERHSVVVQDASGTEIARTDECPGVHGEAAAQPTANGDVVAVGCTDGPVVYRDDAFHKYAPIPGHERSGNLKGVESSSVVLMDGEPVTDGGDARGSTTIGLLDTATDAPVKTVDLGSAYWFRSLDRGPDGEALVLTEDGELNIIDPATGQMKHEVKATEPWTEPEDWQEPAPMLAVADGTAFVADPQHKKLAMIDIASGKTYRTLDLPVIPHEIQVTTGSPSGEMHVGEAGASDAGGEHEGHEHEGHDHEGHDHGGHDHEGEGHAH